MWGRLTLATLIGVAIGVAATMTPFYLYNTAVRDIRAGYLPEGWSAAKREWSAFAGWLRHGGRKLLTDAAAAAAKNGMSEAEVRAIFGPPDFVVVGAEEFEAYSVARMSGARGAYLYKVGRFAVVPDKLISEVFAVVFDPTGRVVYRLGFGVNDQDRLADLDSDTRSERLIAP